MAVVDFALFKAHVKADDFADDDLYLQHLLKTAEKHVIRATRRTVAELTQMGDGEFPAELQHAILMIGAHWYNQRESDAAVQMYQVPDSLSALIKPFRKLVADKPTDDPVEDPTGDPVEEPEQTGQTTDPTDEPEPGEAGE